MGQRRQEGDSKGNADRRSSKDAGKGRRSKGGGKGRGSKGGGGKKATSKRGPVDKGDRKEPATSSRRLDTTFDCSSPCTDVIFMDPPLDAACKVQAGGRLHYLRLKSEVFSHLADGMAREQEAHWSALVQLQVIASVGSEALKSVCMGLTYALLVRPLGLLAAANRGHVRGPGYWDYLALLHSMDSGCVAVRLLMTVALSFPCLYEECAERVLMLAEDMAEAQWAMSHMVFLALQRSACPGKTGPIVLKLVRWLAVLAERKVDWLCADGRAVRLTFIWSLRWVSSLERPPAELQADEAERLRKQLLAFAAVLWVRAQEALLDAGIALLWPLLHVSHEPGFADVWRQALKEEGPWDGEVLASCANHLVSAEEEEHLRFMLMQEDDAAVQGIAENGDFYISWFLDRHVITMPEGRRLANDAHIADILFAALRAAEIAGRPCSWFWPRVLRLAPSGFSEPQVAQAFIFAARRRSCGRDVLVQLLRSLRQAPSGSDVNAHVHTLIAKTLPATHAAGLLRELGPSEA